MSHQPVHYPLDRLPHLNTVNTGARWFLIEEGCPVIVGYAAACLASTLWMPAAPPLLLWSSTVSADIVKCPLGGRNHCRLRTATPNQSIGLERKRRGRDPKTEYPSQGQWFHAETPQHEETKVPPSAISKCKEPATPPQPPTPGLPCRVEANKKYRKRESKNCGSVHYCSIVAGEETESLRLTWAGYLHRLEATPVRLPPRPHSCR